MADHRPPARATDGEPHVTDAVPGSRAQEFREILSDLGQLAGVQGGLIVTPDGLPITVDIRSDSSAEALAALAATLGREIGLGMAQLGQGAFHTAFFSADNGRLFVGASPIGFLMLLGDLTAEPDAVVPALRAALARLASIWR